MPENNNEKVKIELEVDKNIPWFLTESDLEAIKVLEVVPQKITSDDISRVKEECPNPDALKAKYYAMKTELNKLLLNEASQLSESKGKDLALKSEYYKEITLLFLNFLYGSYENQMDRELPEGKAKKTEITQGEFMDFTDSIHEQYLEKLKEIYENEKYRYEKEGVSSELRLKMLFAEYYKRLFSDKNEVSE